MKVVRVAAFLLILLFTFACGGAGSDGPDAGAFDQLSFPGPPVAEVGGAGPRGEAGGTGPSGETPDLAPNGMGGEGPSRGRGRFTDQPLLRGGPPPPNYLVIGLGQAGGGWSEAKTLPGAAAPSHAAWGRIPWDQYTAVDGTSRPAAGDFDGDGRDELAFGLGPAAGGRVYIVDDPGTGLAPLGWAEIQGWNGFNGATYPACVDLDGDGRDELVLGTSVAGWVQVFSYVPGSQTFVPFASTPVSGGYLRVSWTQYSNGASAPVYPAGGNLDGVGGEELVLGLGPAGQGWSQIWTFNGSSLVPYAGAQYAGGWTLVNWGAYNASGDASTYPACGDLDRDGKDDLVVGLSGRGGGWYEVLRSTGSNLVSMPGYPWGLVPWPAYYGGDAPTYPTCGDIDGDTRDDLVIGLGGRGQGWLYLVSGGTFTPPAWGAWTQLAWHGYNAGTAPVYPAIAHGHGAVVTRIDLLPADPTLIKGARQQLQAWGQFSDGTYSEITNSVDWSSDNPAYVTVSATGEATGVEIGATDVTAVCMGVTGRTRVTVRAATLVSIQVDPPDSSLPDGLTQAFTATGLYDDGHSEPLTNAVTWASDNPAAVTIAPTGAATAVDPGQAKITATLGSVSGFTRMTVTDAELVSIQVEPPNPSVPDGLTQQFTAMGTYTDGDVVSITEDVTWSSDDPSAATVSNVPGEKGLATAIDPGAAQITATLGTKSHSRTLTVTDAELVSIQVSPITPSIPDGLTQQFTATGTYTNGDVEPITDDVTWTSDDPSAATVSNNPGEQGLATAVAPGSTRIRASLAGKSNDTLMTVTNAELVSIQVSPANPSVPDGLTQQFTAMGTYTNGDVETITDEVTWSSDNPSAATVSNVPGEKGRATALDPGAAQITATLGGKSDATRMTVTDAELVSIQVEPPNPSVPDGLTQQFTARGTYTDGDVVVITEDVTWSSDNPAAVSISNAPGTRGLATALDPGSAEITASMGGKSDSTEMTVTSVPPPAPPWVHYHAGRSFRNPGTPVWVETGDFNEDGHADVVVSGRDLAPGVHIHLGTGTGDLTPGAEVSTQRGTVQVGDVNQDGHLDVVTAGQSWLGRGDGTFSPGPTFGGFTGDELRMADFNGDNRLDLVFLTNRGILILIGGGDGTFTELSLADGSGLDVGSLQHESDAIAVGDVDGDLDLDVLTAGYPIQFFRNQGDGNFDTGVDAVPVSFGQGDCVTTGDFNGDGRLDLAWSKRDTPALHYRYGVGDGTFTSGPVGSNAGYDFTAVRTIDYNRDGRTDLVANGMVWRGTQDVTNPFLGPTFYAVPNLVFGLDVADFNGDGWPDFVSASKEGGVITVHLNRNGGFGGRNLDPMGRQPAVATGDFNDDGHLDVLSLLYRSRYSVNTRTYYGNGAGQFVAAAAEISVDSRAVAERPDSGSWAESADLNGDGKDDVVLHDPEQGVVQVLLADNGASSGWDVQPGFGPGAFEIQLSDFDLDGKLDLVYLNISQSGTVNYRPGLGDGSFGAAVSVTGVRGDDGPVLLRDFNGDGLRDIGVHVTTAYRIHFAQADGSYTWIDQPTGANGQLAAYGDVNSDGQVDFTVVGGGNLYLVLGQAGGSFSAATRIGAVTRDGLVKVSMADISQDGVDDVVVIDPDTGISVYLSLDDGTFEPERVYGAQALDGKVAELNGNTAGLEIVLAGAAGVFLLER